MLLDLFPAAGFELAGPVDKIFWEDGFVDFVRELRPGQYAAWHYPWNDELSAIVRDHDVAVVFLFRDPRAQALSNLNFIKKTPAHPAHSYFVELADDEQRLLRILSGLPQTDAERLGLVPEDSHRWEVSSQIRTPSLPGGINWVFGIFADWLRDSQCLPVRYEDLVGNRGGGSDDVQVEVVRRILEFTGADAELAPGIANALYSERSPTFHRGNVDSWRGMFQPGVMSAFRAHSSELIDLFGYSA
jgi:hypothetical protein